jgi:hypothetical protein
LLTIIELARECLVFTLYCVAVALYKIMRIQKKQIFASSCKKKQIQKKRIQKKRIFAKKQIQKKRIQKKRIFASSQQKQQNSVSDFSDGY